MPSSDQPPETGSTARMLEVAARASSGGKGETETREVITQEDGSKIVRVRRRKRVSQAPAALLQSSEEEEKLFHLKLLLWSVVSFVVIGLILLGVFVFQIFAHNSPSRVAEIETAIGEHVQAEVNFKGYRVGRASVNVDSITAQSARPNTYDAKFKGLEFKLNSPQLLLGKLVGTKGYAKEAQITLATPSLTYSDAEAAPLVIPYEHTSLSVDRVNVTWGFDGPQKHRFAINHAEGKFMRRKKGGFQANIRNGLILNSGTLPPVWEQSSLIIDSAGLTINSLRLSDGDVGILSLEGSYERGGPATQDLSANIENLKLQNIHPQLARVVEARISTPKSTDKRSYARLNPVDSSFEITSDFLASESGFVLKHFQFLDYISNKLGSLSQASIVCNKLCQGTITISPTGYQFKDLDLESIANIAITGDLQISADGSLSGDLSVGLPVSDIISNFPHVKRGSVETRRGYVWIPLTLSGTTDLPKDDFAINLEKTVASF